MGSQPEISPTQPGSPPNAPPSPAELAPHFPQLEILELVGQGGMGIVYKARQLRLERWVALKILPADPTRNPSFAERFTREARALASLSHPNIVAVYDFGEVNGIYFFVMEYVDGLNLRQLERAGQLTAREALKIVPAICEALQYAHDQGIVHRDIKPENILVDKQGRVKIADFGLAKLLGRPLAEPALTAERQVMGTPHYMAPEQIEDPQHVDHRADIYSLGVVFYEMLTGELPLGRFEPPSRKMHVDVRLDEVVLRALEKERERRYQHASEVKSDVETISHEGPRESPTPQQTVAVEPWAALRQSVKAPATALLVTGILNWLCVPILALLATYFMARQGAGSHGPLLTAILVAMLASTFILVAAFKMRSLEAWGAAVTASVLAMLLTPANVVGLPVGIWSLVTLLQRPVRDAFRQHPPLPAPAALPAGSPPDRARRWFFTTATVCLIGFALLLFLGLGGLMVSIALPAFLRARAHAQMLARDASQTSLIKAFGMPDQPLSPDVIATNNAWLVQNDRPHIIVPLFEIPNPDVVPGRLTFLAQLKTQDLRGHAYLEMWCRFPRQGEFFGRGLNHSAEGSMDWGLYDTMFFLKPGEKPDLIKLNLVVEGPGQVWIRDVQLRESDAGQRP